jgi:ATP-binding cassette, subfamily B, multidrug efflux pump
LKYLFYLRKYFWQNKYRFFLGILFTVLSNYFGVLSPQVTKYVINRVTAHLEVVQKTNITDTIIAKTMAKKPDVYEPIVKKIVTTLDTNNAFGDVVIICGIILLALALLRGFFTYLMRQTIIVMSRHIEFSQKNDVYAHYQKLDTHFFKTNSTGDLMNRISEDVGKVRMFTGPAIMYSINLLALISLSVFYMFKTNPILTLYTISPLPILAFIIYKVNTIINRKSELQQEQLSTLTSNAQESYSGIRVIKSFAQETASVQVFEKNSTEYKNRAIDLAKTEAWYFPSIALLIGLSTLVTIMIGGLYKINGDTSISVGTIAEFVVYINMLTFPVSSIGWVASIIQRASASQKRISAFLLQNSSIKADGVILFPEQPITVHFNDVSFVYSDTNIQALKDINFTIAPNEKIAIVGKTGSGKTTLVQLLLRLYNPTSGTINLNNNNIQDYQIDDLRKNMAYVPQEVFLFSDTILNNIKFGVSSVTQEQVIAAAQSAHIYNELLQFADGLETMVGERGVTLSGGQKQRISIARALLKQSKIYFFDDCLSAVDVNTEVSIIKDLQNYLQDKTAIFVTHRIYNLMNFDKIIVLENGHIVEMGNHEALLAKQGAYYKLHQEQQMNK